MSELASSLRPDLLRSMLASSGDSTRRRDLLDDAASGFPIDALLRVLVASGDDGLAYADFLTWRGMLTPEPPRRPEPTAGSARQPSCPAAPDWVDVPGYP